MAQVDIVRITDVRALSPADAALANSFSISNKDLAEAGSTLPTTEQAFDPFAKLRVRHAYDKRVAASTTSQAVEPGVDAYLTLPDPVTEEITHFEDGVAGLGAGQTSTKVVIDLDEAALIRRVAREFVVKPGGNGEMTLTTRRDHGTTANRDTHFLDRKAKGDKARVLEPIDRRSTKEQIKEGVIVFEGGQADLDSSTKDDQDADTDTVASEPVEKDISNAIDGEIARSSNDNWDWRYGDEDSATEAAWDGRFTGKEILPEAQGFYTET